MFLFPPSPRSDSPLAPATIRRGDITGPLPQPDVHSQDQSRECQHCGAPSPADAGYCCRGCEAAASLLGNGLEKFYALQQGARRVGTTVDADEQLPPWLEREIDADGVNLKGTRGGLRSVTCRVTGIHCAACSWVIPELAKRAGAMATEVNAGKGTLTLRLSGDPFDAATLLHQLRTLGYDLFPLGETPPSATSPMLMRTGLAVALALNTMLLSLSRYFGLDAVDGALFIGVEAVLMVLAVGIGGAYFFKRAIVALQNKTLSLDVPVALGIALGAAGSLVAYVFEANATYFDTVTLFIAFMLVGRTFQAFTSERAQAQVRAPTTDHQWFVRRQRPLGGVEVVSASVLCRGDTIEVGPNDLVIVETSTTEKIDISNEWLTGEPESVVVDAQCPVPVGAKYRGRRTTGLVVTAEFDAQRIADLLAPAIEDDELRPTDWLRTVSELYPPAVLCLALAGFGLWYRTSTATAFEVMVSLLVITCPCALGLAIPLAYELAAASARKLGVIVCRPSVLDRLPTIDTVVFDKTGTATLGELCVDDTDALEALNELDRRALCALTRNSRHPRSQAVSVALGEHKTPTDVDCFFEEVGGGVQARIDQRWFRFGSASFCQQPDTVDGASVFVASQSRDGPFTRISLVRFQEQGRPNARREMTALQQMGIDVQVLSGDAQSRVGAFAHAVGLPLAAAHGQQSPTQKRDALVALKRSGHVVAMVGDGLNDAAALDVADVRAVPGLTVPGAARACDLASVSPNLLPMAGLIALSQRLRLVVRANAVFAGVFNLCAAGLALSGLVTPLFAAIWMPVGSLFVVLLTTAAMRNAHRLTEDQTPPHPQGRYAPPTWATSPSVDVTLLEPHRSLP